MKSFLYFTAALLGAWGCSSKQNFPWSLDGKIIPPYKIHRKEDVSVSGSVTYSLGVIVPKSITKEELTLVSQKIIQDLPKHNLVLIFYFADPKEVENEFTIGKAWWGVDDINYFPRPGDYSRHVLKIERR